MAGVLLPFLKWFIGGSGTKSLKLLNFVVRSPWKTIDAIGEVRSYGDSLQMNPFHLQFAYAVEMTQISRVHSYS